MKKVSAANSLSRQKSHEKSRRTNSAGLGSQGGPRQPASALAVSSDVAACSPVGSQARRVSVHGDVAQQRKTYSTARRAMMELRTAELEAPPDGQGDDDKLDGLHIGLPVSRSSQSLLRQATTATRIGTSQALQEKRRPADDLARTVLAAKGMDRLKEELQEFDLSETMMEQVGEIFECVKELGIRDPAPIVNQISHIFLRHELSENFSDLRAELEKELKELEKTSVGLQLASELAKHHSKQQPIKDRLMSSARSLWMEVKYTKAFGNLYKPEPAASPMAAPQDRQQPAHWRQLRTQREIAARLRREVPAQEQQQPARWRQLRTQRQIAARLQRNGAAQPLRENEDAEEMPRKPSPEAGAAAAVSSSACLQRSNSVATAASGEAVEPSEDSPRLVRFPAEWEDDDHDDNDFETEVLDEPEESEYEVSRPAVAPDHASSDVRSSDSSNSDEERGRDHEQESHDFKKSHTMPACLPSGSDVDEEDAGDLPVVDAVTAGSRLPAKRQKQKRKKQKEVGALLPKVVHPEKALLPKVVHPEKNHMSSTFSASFSTMKRAAAPCSTFSGSFYQERRKFPPLLSIQLPACESRSAAIRRAGKRAQGDTELETIQLNWDSELHYGKRRVEAVPRPKLPWLVEEQRCPSMAFGSSGTSHLAAEYQGIEAVARDLGHSSKLRDAGGHDRHSAMRPQSMFKKLIEVKDEGPSLTGFCRFHRSLRHVI